VKPQFIVFVGCPEKEGLVWENDTCRGLYKIGFLQEPQKRNDTSRNNKGFTVNAFLVDTDCIM
jgi:hypothetical protein